MQFELDPPVAQGLLTYLAGRPWGEVNTFLALLLPQVERQQVEAAAAAAARTGPRLVQPGQEQESVHPGA